MSDIPRWSTCWPPWFGIHDNVTVVPASDYDALKAELAASQVALHNCVAVTERQAIELAACQCGWNTAQANYQFMVERAADRHLEGYRELGAKCAALEERAERAEAALAVSAQQVDSLAASVRQLEAEREAIRHAFDALETEKIEIVRDAERYRLLRSEPDMTVSIFVEFCDADGEGPLYSPSDIDDKVDGCNAAIERRIKERGK